MEEEIKYCENCKRDISSKNYVIHTVHCERNIKLCIRCSEPVPRSELEQHEEEFHSEVVCLECGISLEKWQIEKHKETCVKKLVPCEYCELEVPLDTLPEHIDVCGSRTELCPKCKKHIMRKDLVQHPVNCSRGEPVKVPCEYCGLQINLSEMEHIIICGTRTERCLLCNENVMVKDKDIHSRTCGKKRQTSPKFSCKYCGELYHSDFLEDHADNCGNQTRKCEKCDKFITLKNMEMHSNVCIKNVSKTHGNCPVCRQSIPWVDMNLHYTSCTRLHTEINEYEYQNKINEFALMESEDLKNEISDQRKSQLDEDQKQCVFCCEKFPYYRFHQHLEACPERPYNCDACSKAMPYRKKEEHEHNCLYRRMHVDDYMLHDEETDDNKELKKLKKCQFCDLRFPDLVFYHHLKECEHREEKCAVCLKNVPVKDMQNHKLFTCTFTPSMEKNFTNRNNTHAEAFPGPSRDFEGKGYLEENVKVCPSCKCKIPIERFHDHLHLCRDGKTQCHFCGMTISKTDEHSHFRFCYKIFEIAKQDNPPNKKKKGKANKGKSLSDYFSSWFNPSHTWNHERNFDSRQTYRRQNYENNMAPMHPVTGINEINELPCEFCNQMWPSELLIQHESGCRPDLVSFPKDNDGEKFAAAAAAAVSQSPVLDANLENIRDDDDGEWKVFRRNQTSRERERNSLQTQTKGKDNFFFSPTQDIGDTSENQPNSCRKKRYPQMKESQESSNVKTEPRQSDDHKKSPFAAFKFSSSRNDESEKESHFRRKNDDVLSIDMTKYDETKKNDYSEHRIHSTESSAIVDYPKSNFNRELRAIGFERTEKKRILHSREGVDSNKDFEEIPVQKSNTFDEKVTSELSKCLKTTETRTFNLNMPALWNTESSLGLDQTLRNHSLKSLDDNEALCNAAEIIDHKAFDLSRQETDYDAKNKETFGISFMKSINNKNEENVNDTKSDRSNSDEIFFDADDGGTKHFDTINDNFHDSNRTQEEKSRHFDFGNNLSFGSRNQNDSVNPTNHEYLKVDIRREEEDLNLKDCDIDVYLQFLNKSIRQSDGPSPRIGELENPSYRTVEVCKCGNAKCSCVPLTLIQKASVFQACSFKDASCNKSFEPLDIEPLGVETNLKNKMKSKTNKEFSSKKEVEDENTLAMKWKKWRASGEKFFSSDSE